MSGWDVARDAQPCRSLDCRVTIGAGEQGYRQGPQRLWICQPCAARRFDQHPPAEMPAVTMRSRLARLERMAPVSSWADAKLRQMAPERDE